MIESYELSKDRIEALRKVSGMAADYFEDLAYKFQQWHDKDMSPADGPMSGYLEPEYRNESQDYDYPERDYDPSEDDGRTDDGSWIGSKLHNRAYQENLEREQFALAPGQDEFDLDNIRQMTATLSRGELIHYISTDMDDQDRDTYFNQGEKRKWNRNMDGTVKLGRYKTDTLRRVYTDWVKHNYDLSSMMSGNNGY